MARTIRQRLRLSFRTLKRLSGKHWPSCYLAAICGGIALSKALSKFANGQFPIIPVLVSICLLLAIGLAIFLTKPTKRGISGLVFIAFIIIFAFVYDTLALPDTPNSEKVAQLLKTYTSALIILSSDIAFREGYARAEGTIIRLSGETTARILLPVVIYADNERMLQSGTYITAPTSKIRVTGDSTAVKLSLDGRNISAAFVPKGLLSGWIASFNGALMRSFMKNYDRWTGGMLYAIFTGRNNLFYTPLQNAFRMSGTSHLFALSGMHLGVLIAVIGYFTRLPLIASAASFLFMMLTGFPVSLVRSFFTLILTQLISLSGTRQSYEKFMCALFAAVFVTCPRDVGSISFMLSYSAIAGLIFTCDMLSREKYKKMPGIAKALLISVVVSLFQIPIMLRYFGRIPLASPLFNLFAIPFFGLAVNMSLVSLFFSAAAPFAPILATLTAVTSGKCFALLSIMLCKCGGWGGFITSGPFLDWLMYLSLALVYCSSVLLLSMGRKKRDRAMKDEMVTKLKAA